MLINDMSPETRLWLASRAGPVNKSSAKTNIVLKNPVVFSPSRWQPSSKSQDKSTEHRKHEFFYHYFFLCDPKIFRDPDPSAFDPDPGRVRARDP